MSVATIWINAFIPRDVDSAIRIENGPYAGKYAIPGPITAGDYFDYFLTDNRTFSNDMEEPARMHSRMVFNFDGIYGAYGPPFEFSFCSPTVKLSRSTGVESCKKSASGDRMKVNFLGGSCGDAAGRLSAKFHFIGAASNPCFPGAPDIDWDLQVIAYRNADLKGGTIEVTGLVEPFPAFEMYFQPFEGRAFKVFTIGPEPGSSPFDLIGGPNRHVSTTTSFSL